MGRKPKRPVKRIRLKTRRHQKSIWEQARSGLLRFFLKCRSAGRVGVAFLFHERGRAVKTALLRGKRGFAERRAGQAACCGMADGRPGVLENPGYFLLVLPFDREGNIPRG